MSNQLQITGGAKVRALEGVITGTTGVLSSVPYGGANGVATLDSAGKIPVSQLPNSVMEYKGTWNVTTNTPYLVNGVGNAGDVYMVVGAAVGGTNHDFGSGNILFYNGDQAIYDGSAWQRASGSSGTVTSVAVAPGSSVSALSISGSPITNAGTITIDFAGTNSQYVTGSGGLTTFPSLTGFVPYTGATNDLNLGTHNLYANNIFDGFINVAASGSQIVLTIASTPSYTITGSGGQTIKLPDATTLPNGAIFSFNNNQSSGAITINNNSNTLVVSVPSGGFAEVVLLDNSIAAGSWDRHFKAPANVSWSTNTLDYAGSITSATWNGNVVAINRGGTGSSTQNFVDLTTTQTIGGAKTFSSSLTASSLIKTGGTSSQFLKADGSVDSSSYITLTSLSFTAGSGAYNSTTGIITIPTNNNQITNGAGYITSSALSTYVPYTGATANLNLGIYTINSNSITITQASPSITFNSNIWSANSYIQNNVTINALGTGNYLVIGNPTGKGFSFVVAGTSVVSIEPNGALTSVSFIKSGGTSSQFLKADGSIDSSIYLTTSTASSTYLALSGGILTGATSIQANYKFWIQSNSSSYGQLQIGNNTALGEASMIFIGGIASGMGTSTPTSGDGTSALWSIGANIYGIGTNFFGVGNVSYGSTIFKLKSTGEATFVSSITANSFSTPSTGVAGSTIWSLLHDQVVAGDFGIYNPSGAKIYFNAAGITTFYNNIQLGTIGTATGTSTPLTINLGDTYSNTAGSNLKLKLFADSTGGSYGIGVSGSQMDFNLPTSAQYKFWSGNAIFTNNVTALSFIKSGGTSSQFLKADGSIDSTAYGTGTFSLPSLTTGSVLFSNGSTIAQNNSQFFWDNTNNRLGLGTATPSVKLDIFGAGDGTYFNIQYAGGQLASIDAVGTSVSGHGVLNLGKAGTTNVVINGFGDSYITGGNLGVGINSPTYRLHVSGTLGVTGAATLSSTLSAGNLFFGSYNSSTAGSIWSNAYGAASLANYVAYFDTTATIFNSLSGGMYLRTLGADRLSITNSGAITLSNTLGVSGVSTFSSNIYMQSSGNPSQLLAKGTNTEFWVDSQYGGGTARVFINRNTTSNQATLMFTTGVSITNGTAWAGSGVDWSMGMTTDLTNNFYIGYGDIYSSSNRKITIASSGATTFYTNVGIGMTPITSNGGLQIGNSGGAAPSIYFTKGTTAAYFGVDAYGTDVFGGGTTGAYDYIFVTNSQIRMRINTSGQLLINKSTSADAGRLLDFAGAAFSSGTNAGYFWENRSNSANFYGWYTTGGTIYIYNGSANAASISPSTGVYTPLSDINKKKDFEESKIGLNAILRLKPTLYRMKSDDELTSKELGFIAQEVKEFIPQAYVENGDEKDKFIGLNYNAIIAASVKAIQEQQIQIEELKQQVQLLLNK